MKTKDFPLVVKAEDIAEDGTFEGYASVSGNVDAYGEIMAPGAFAKSLAKHKREGTKPLLLWQHDTRAPIGVWEDLAEDGKGLWGKGILLRGVRLAEEALILLKAGALRGLSVGYREVRAEEGSPRKVLEAELVEASIVSLPANRQARVEMVKSERMEELARRFRDGDPLPVKDFEEILREAGFPKSAALQIASVGYVKAIRSESEGNQAKQEAAIADIRAAVGFLKKAS